MKTTICLSIIFFLITLQSKAFSQVDKSDWIKGYPDGCTSITVGNKASFDGSVMTSHTDDSHRTRSWMNVIGAKDYKDAATVTMYKRTACDSFAMPTYQHTAIGEIPQVPHTYGYINTAYPCMNEKQLAIGESTFGGRDELQSDKGLIDCQRLCQLMLERCTSAREAIILGGELITKYGWNDAGECLTIADTKEVWHMEIVGSGTGEIGAVWVAQRVPDDHISVNANASTIKEIDLDNTDYFMASENIYSLAEQNGWYNPKEETFKFCYAYAPKSRESVAARRREWRVFDLVAPSLKLNPNDKDYPFSVKPEEKITLEKMVFLFKDYFEGTPYDMTRNIKSTDDEGKTIISPLANPFMPYEQLELSGVSGGWYYKGDDGHYGFLGERTIARWYTMYGTILQCRSWLPDEVGGVAWIAQDNIATSIYVPFYCCVTDMPASYKTPGRPNGYTQKSAWWAFNRLGTLTAQRWGDMRHDVDAVWKPLQEELFAQQKQIDQEAMKLYKEKNTKKTVEYLNKYSNEWGEKVVEKAWGLGDFLWTKYDEKF